LRNRLANEVRGTHDVTVVQPPTRGLAMVQVRETAQRTRFLMGELLVTEAKVQIDGVLGLGILAGHDDAAALDLATIDAAHNAGLPLCDAWQVQLETARIALVRQYAEEDEVLLGTRVRFDTMEIT